MCGIHNEIGQMQPCMAPAAPFLEKIVSMPTFLNIGCSPPHKDRTTRAFNTPEWTEQRLDIDASVSSDITGTVTDMSAVANASVDAIFSSHNIEHLYPHEVPLALKEFLRCSNLTVLPSLPARPSIGLRPGRAQQDHRAGVHRPSRTHHPRGILCSHRPSMARGDLHMAHRCGFTRKVLEGTLKAAGFKTVATMARGRAPFFDLWALASKSERSADQMLELAGQHFPILQPTVVATV